MLFYKPIVSLVAGLAAVSGVAASATPMARQSFPPPNLTPVPASSCTGNVGTLQCCNALTSTLNPLSSVLAGLLGLSQFLNPALAVGFTCPSLTGNQCTNSPVCCTNVSQYALVAVGCTPVTLNA